MDLSLSDARPEDFDRILEINNAAVPNVNWLDLEALTRLAAMAAYFKIARVGDEIGGFLLALTPEADYDSLNFQWFKDNYDQFVYIDRVVVETPYRGTGIGRIFYADIQSFAELRAPYLTCEVNLEPRNDASLLFHGTSGFQEVGQQQTEQGSKTVSLQLKTLPSYEFVRQKQWQKQN